MELYLHLEPIPKYEFKKVEHNEDLLYALGTIHNVLTDNIPIPYKPVPFSLYGHMYEASYNNLRLWIREIGNDNEYQLCIPDIESYRFLNRLDTIRFNELCNIHKDTEFADINITYHSKICDYCSNHIILTIEDIFTLITTAYNETCDVYNTMAY